MKSFMHPLGYSWNVSSGPDMWIDYCVWVLERDGLRVGAFDRHADDDGSLRAAGMTAEAWQAWLGRVCVAVREFSRQLGGDDWPPWPEPVALWQGAPAVGVRLAELETEYKDLSNDRKDVSRHLWWPEGDYQDEPAWESLEPFDTLLPPLSVYYVAYPGPARLVVPPATVVLAAAGWHPAPGELTAAVVAGATELAEGAARERGNDADR